MFISFDENVFRQAIKAKDYQCLKVNTVSTILNDPTFERGETDKVLEILKEEVPDIFDKYIELDYEERLERNSWDKRYFTKLTYWFQENFAEERVAYIKEVGRVVHKDTAKRYAESMAIQGKTTAESKDVQYKKQEKKERNFLFAGAILAVGALVFVGILLFKILTN